MSLSKLTENLNNVSSLPDKPTLDADELKSVFDSAGNTIKEYINETLTEEIDDMEYNLNQAINNKSITKQKKDMFDLIYPVGSIYMSVNNVNPSTLFGGTWEQLKDRFLLGAGDSYTNGTTGGNSTHTHTVKAHNHTTGNSSVLTSGSTSLSVSQIPSHNHKAVNTSSNVNVLSGIVGRIARNRVVGVPSSSFGDSVLRTFSCDDDNIDDLVFGGNETSKTGSGNGHTHTIPAHNHGNTGTLSQFNTGSSNSLPPYLTVYMWKRTGL